MALLVCQIFCLFDFFFLFLSRRHGFGGLFLVGFFFANT